MITGAEIVIHFPMLNADQASSPNPKKMNPVGAGRACCALERAAGHSRYAVPQHAGPRANRRESRQISRGARLRERPALDPAKGYRTQKLDDGLYLITDGAGGVPARIDADPVCTERFRR